MSASVSGTMKHYKISNSNTIYEHFIKSCVEMITVGGKSKITVNKTMQETKQKYS